MKIFKIVIEMTPPEWIMDIVHVDVLSEQNIVVVEFLELKENKVLMGTIEKERLIGWLKVKSSHPLLFENVVLFLLGFPTALEIRFSAANDVLTKKYDLW